MNSSFPLKSTKDRFPSDFMFELSKDEYANLRSQFVTLERGQHSLKMTVISPLSEVHFW